MKNDLRIDFTKNEIIMSRSFEKCASIAGSEEYRRLQLVRQDYPNFSVVRRSIKKAPTKVTYAGLTYAYMEAYIAGHDQDGTIKKVYDELRLIGACHKSVTPPSRNGFWKHTLRSSSSASMMQHKKSSPFTGEDILIYLLPLHSS